MNIQGFDYIQEKTRLNELKKQNFGLWLRTKNELLQKTKFSLNEVTEYLEHGICQLKKENWTIRRIAFYDEETKQVDLAYYALDNGFDELLKSLVKRGSKADKEVQESIDFLKKNDLIFLMGNISFYCQKRAQLFDQIDRIENEQKNYLEEEFFHFPIAFENLYNVIIDHINRKNNNIGSYKKSY